MIDSSGIGVYLNECLPFFLASSHNFILFGNSARLMVFKSFKNIEIVDCNIKTFSIKELFLFPGNILNKINKTDIYYSPFFNIPGGISIPVYTTIHDIIFPDIPGLVSPPGLALRMWFYRRAVRLSQKIFTVSFFSKSRIEHFLGNRKPVVVTHIAVKSAFLSNIDIHKPKKDTVIFIGNIKKHKGLQFLLEAFTLARAEGLKHKLVIVGSRDNFRSSDNTVLRQIGSFPPDSQALEFTDQVSDEDLAKLLSESSLLVQPSLYEGFGLPPLEAMVLGTKALVSDIPVFKEIYQGFPVVFFKTGDSLDLKEKMLNLLCNKKPETVILSRQLAEKYTFQKTAAIIMDNWIKK
jgi:glycosyltransferase involved in cell wall biosynthesis